MRPATRPWFLALGLLVLLAAGPGCRPPEPDDDDDDDSADDDDSSDDDDVADDDTGDDDTGDDDTGPGMDVCFPATWPATYPAPAPDLPAEARGYYDDIDPEAANLKSDLHQLISQMDTVGYDSLWDAFEDTDDDGSGRVWDIYSDNPGGSDPYSYWFNDECGQYDSEGDCYNREHSWPTSWTGEDGRMKSDLFHVYPTDGYVNNRRDNHPYGVVDDVHWESENGSLLGDCLHGSQTVRVFEPIDAYKGDLARTYFYVAVAYMGSSWSSNEMVSGARIDADAEAMLRAWHASDPVSGKETSRNQAVYSLQDNRNPFIDHPEWVDLITDF